MTLVALTILLGALLLVANEYELRKRKERRRLECQEAINTLEYRLGLRWDQHDQRVEHGAGTIDLRGGIAPGVAIPVDGSPQDFFMQGFLDEIARIGGNSDVAMGLTREQEARLINERRQEQYAARIDKLRRSIS